MNRDSRLKALEQARKRRIISRNAISSIDITKHIAGVYEPLHADIKANAHQYYNLPGGRGSCKSSFVSLEIVSGIMSDFSGLSNAIVFRRFASTMRESVFSQIAWAIAELGVSHLWRGGISPMQYTYIPTGQQIIFRGLDDPSKLKSIKPRHGNFRYVWFEEFSELSGMNFVRSVMQSVVRGQGDFTVFRSFNPPMSKANWANAFIALPDDRAVTLHTSYLDIPPEWLGDSFIYEAERLKTINETAYRHEYLGEATGSGGEVFPNITEQTINDTDISRFQYIYAGIDFGFAVDPCVFLRVAYDRQHEKVYILDEIYKKHIGNKELACQIKSKGYDKSGMSSINYFGSIQTFEEKQNIICDCAEPKSIADLKTEGLKAFPCKKYQGSVLYGIKWLQRRQIIIDPKRTPNAYREFTQYEYMQGKDGEFLSDVPDRDNHCIDSCRYALDRVINSRQYSA
ncbi:MAG: PBSX family phage terminase large subunit [Ruminococcus sp.]|nr:PBSX family phage terminase large subunit [Ruminococcus sp.]